MGRIKSTMVKRAAESLMKQEMGKYTSHFNDNKKVLGSTMPSKPIRNKIAGYLARLVKMQEKPRVITKKPVEQESELQ